MVPAVGVSSSEVRGHVDRAQCEVDRIAAVLLLLEVSPERASRLLPQLAEIVRDAIARVPDRPRGSQR